MNNFKKKKFNSSPLELQGTFNTANDLSPAKKRMSEKHLLPSSQPPSE